jgi:thiol-disulfide isomerase/thioredoxin
MRVCLMRRSWMILLCALLLVGLIAHAENFTVRVHQTSEAVAAFNAVHDTASSFAAEKAFARTMQQKYPDDIELQIRVASFLASENVDSVRAYYEARAAREPNSVIAQYLAGRLQATPAAQRGYSDKLLAQDPNSYWGNLLLAGSYSAKDDPGLQQAEAALRKAIAQDNSLPYAVERLGHLLRQRGDTLAADQVYTKLADMQPGEFQPYAYRIMLVAPDHHKIIKLCDEFLAKYPQNVPALYAEARAQRELSDWPGHVATMRRVVAVERTGDHAYDLACGFSLAGEKDSAFTWLFTAADLGFSDIEQYKADDDLVSLRTDPRWSDLLVRVDGAEKAKMAEFLKQAAANAPQRKQEALADRQTAAAPDFTFEDLDGNKVALASLRGKIVILDFWATWCGPCRKTMPLVEKFFTEKKSKDILVYGMNVWERGDKSKVKPFITERKFHFPILLGSNDIAEAYGVRGIPTLFVIDQQGRIAYRHVGYDPTMAEILAWQTNELLKAGKK